MQHHLPERRLIVINGPQALALSAANQLIQRSGLEQDSVYRLQSGATGLTSLGQDFSVVLIDAYQGLNPDTLGRVSGAIVAGGALIIVCPKLSEWADYADPENRKLVPYPDDISYAGNGYIARWVRLLKNMEGSACLSPEQAQSAAAIEPARIDAVTGHAITPDQQAAIDAICKAATGRRKHPAIITAARGRGKSSALGLAAGALIQTQSCQNIIVTSSGLRQLKTVFKHAQAVLPDSQISTDGKTLLHANGSLRYVATDVLISQTKGCDLLLVDEAASLGVSRLLQLLESYPRLAFSSTEHGYEGSGRGFSLKFKQLIQAYCRGSYSVSLSSPVRWREYDPLEAWTNELLLLEVTTPVIHTPKDINFPKLEFKLISHKALVDDEDLLKCVFALLIDAHYRTRPVDLRYLLDAPNTQLWATHQNGDLVGLIWLMQEGGLDSAIASDIVSGKRRPQGHLAPQILGAHLGLEEAITLHCTRIQRIVVHPDLQNLGLGRWMLNAVKSHVQSETDYLASSFGADLPLSRFWIGAGYQAVRLSDQTHAASGLRSALMINPVSSAAYAMASDASHIVFDQLICQLADSLCDQPCSLIFELTASLTLASRPLINMTDNDFKAACLFSYSHRPYESSLPALTHLAMQLLSSPRLQIELGTDRAGLYITRILQHQSWERCAYLAGLSGKKPCLQSIRLSSQIILETHFPSERIDAIREKYALVTIESITPAS